MPQALRVEVSRSTGLRAGIYLDTSVDEAYAWASQLALGDVPENLKGTFRKKFAVLRVEVPEEATYVDDPDVTDIGQEASAYITDQRIPPERISLVEVVEAEWG